MVQIRKTKTASDISKDLVKKNDIVSESAQKTAIKLDTQTLKKAKVVLIFRENGFLNMIASELKKRRGTDICTVTVEAGTESLSENDLKKMEDVFKITKESGILTLTDSTVPVALCKVQDKFDHWDNFLSPTKLTRRGVWEKREDAKSIMMGNSNELRLALTSLAKRAKEYGATSVVLVLSKTYEIGRKTEDGNGISAAGLDEHGIVINKNGKDIEYNFRNPIKNADELRTVYEFIEKILKSNGLDVYPAKVGGKIVGTELNLEDMKTYNKEFVNIEVGKEASLDLAKTAVLIDRHADLQKVYGAVFIKHEYNIIEDVKAGDYLPIIGAEDKKSATLYVDYVDNAIQKKLEGKKE